MEDWKETFLDFILRRDNGSISGQKALALEMAQHMRINHKHKTLDVFLGDVACIVKGGTREG